MALKLALPTLGKSIVDIINDAAEKIQQGGQQVQQQIQPQQRHQQINQAFQIKAPEINSLVPGSENVDDESKEESEEPQPGENGQYASLLDVQEKQASENNWQNDIPRTRDLGLNYDQALMRPNDFQYDIEDRQDIQKARDAGLAVGPVKLQDRPKDGQVESRSAHDFRRSVREAEEQNKAEHGADYDAWPDWFRSMENWLDAQQIMGQKGYDPLRYAQAEIGALGEGLNRGTQAVAQLRNRWANDTAEYQFDVGSKKNIDAEDFDAARDSYQNMIEQGPDAVPPEERSNWLDQHWVSDRSLIGNRSAIPYRVTNYGLQGVDNFSFNTDNFDDVNQQVNDMIMRGDIVRDGDGYLVNGVYVPDLQPSQTTEQLPADQMDNADYYQVLDNMILPDGTELTADEVNAAASAPRYQSNLLPFNINKANPEVLDENYNFQPGSDLVPAAVDGLLGSGLRMLPTVWPILGGDLIARAQGVDPGSIDQDTNFYADPGANNTIDRYALGFVNSLFNNVGERYIGKAGGDLMINAAGGEKAPLRNVAALGVANAARKAVGSAPKEELGRLGKTAAGTLAEGWEEILAGPFDEFGQKGLNAYSEPYQLEDGTYAYDPESLQYIYQYDTPIERRLNNFGWSSASNALLGGMGGLAMHGAGNSLGYGMDKWQDRTINKELNRLQRQADEYDAEMRRQENAELKPGDDAAIDYYEQQKAKANK